MSSEGFAARGAALSEGAGSSGEAALHEGAGAAWADAAGGDVEPVTGVHGFGPVYVCQSIVAAMPLY